MKTLIKIITLSLLLLLFQGCLPDSMEKWDDSGTAQTITLIDPPSNLSYAPSSYTYSKGVTITTVYPATITTPVGYPVTFYSISPSLDGTGLTFNNIDGSISGAPGDYLSQTTYTITATNAGGSDTTTIQIQVPVVVPTALSYDNTIYLYSLDTNIGVGPTPTLAPANVSPCVFSISPSIEDDSGLNFDTTDGTFSGSPTSLIVNQLTGTIDVAAAGTAVTGTGTSFSTELTPGAKVIIYDASGNPKQCSAGICEVGSISSNTAFTLVSGYSGAVDADDVAIKSLGKFYTVRAATDTSTTLGSFQEKSIFIGINTDSLSSFTYPQASYSLAREIAITDIEPTTTLGDNVIFSIEKGAVTNALKQFTYETGLDFDTTTGVISGTPAPASYLRATVLSTDIDVIEASRCTTGGPAVFTCSSPIKIKSDTSPAFYGYIYQIDIANNYIYFAVKSPTKIKQLVNTDIVTDEESLGFSATLGGVTAIATPNGDNHGYLAGETYTVVATDNLGNSVSRDITISVYKTSPTSITYPTTLSFTNGVATNPSGATSVNGDAFNRRYTISPDINSITGLTFDTTTGELSGTPSTASIPINYTITVYTETDADDGTTPFASQTSTSANVNIGVYNQLSTDMEYTQSRKLMVDLANFTPGVPAASETIATLNGNIFTAVINNISTDQTQITFTKDDPTKLVNVGDTLVFSGADAATVVAVTNIYSVGESISLAPAGPSVGTPTSYVTNNSSGITWNSTTGAITGTMTADFTTQSYTIYGRDPVSQTNTISFSIAATSEEPNYLNYSNTVALSVGDTSSFVVGGNISGKDASNNKAYGTVLKVSLDENLLLVQVNSGRFVDEMSLDNAAEYFSEETTTSNFYIFNIPTPAAFVEGETIIGGTSGAIATIRHIDGTSFYVQVTSGSFQNGETVTGQTSAASDTIDTAINNGIKKDEPAKYNSTVLNVTAASADDFDIGGYISTTNGSANLSAVNDLGIITYVDDSADEIYVRIVKGDFAQGDTIHYYAADETDTAFSTAILSLESPNVTLGLSAPLLNTFSVGGDITTSANEVGTVHKINGAADTLDISVTVSSNPSIMGRIETTGAVDNANPYSASEGATISTVTHDHAFYLYARKSVNIVPTINHGNVDATYSITPALMPDGVTFSTTDGSISGTPTGSFPEQSYTVTATSILDSSQTATFSFSIKVYDYIELTNHTTDAASYILHKEGQSNNSTPCRILADHLDVDSAPTTMCRLEAGELDLHQQGLTFGASVGAGICNYVRFVPFYYNRYEYIVDNPQAGDNNDTASFNTYTQSGTCSTCSGTSLATASGCPTSWNTYYREQDTLAATEIDSPSCSADYDSYANCSEGEYAVRTYTCTESSPTTTSLAGTVTTVATTTGVNGGGTTTFLADFSVGDTIVIAGESCGGGDCIILSITDNDNLVLEASADNGVGPVGYGRLDTGCTCEAAVTTVACTGSELNCKDGPAIGFGDISSRPDMGKTVATYADGAVINNWSFAAPSIQNPYQDSNLSLANYVSSNRCDNGDYLYHHYSWQGYSKEVNAQDPFQKSSSSSMGPVNPYYTLYCLDESHNVKGKILLQVREWDKSFTVADDIDKTIPSSKMDNVSFSNHYDWDDFFAPDVGIWTPKEFPVLPTLVEGNFINAKAVCGVNSANLTGTVNITAGSTLVQANAATAFTSELNVGDAIEIAGVNCAGKSYCEIAAIINSSTLYLALPSATTVSGATYTVRQEPGFAASPYLSGTVTTVAASATVNGVGTAFTTELRIGETLNIVLGAGFETCNGGNCIISSITNDTTLTLTENADAGSAAVGYFAGTFLSGTVTTTGADATVTGAGTAFLSEVRVGATLYIEDDAGAMVTCGGAACVVSSITSDTALTLTANTDSAEAGVSYFAAKHASLPQSYQ